MGDEEGVKQSSPAMHREGPGGGAVTRTSRVRKRQTFRNIGDACMGQEGSKKFDICSAFCLFVWFICEEPKTFFE